MTPRTNDSPSSGDADAIALLKADHKRMKALFKRFAASKKEAEGSETKRDLVADICRELLIHTELEEEVFYPAVRKQIDDADLMDEALVEHAGAKELIAQLEAMDPEDDLYDAKVTVLGEQVEQHVKEEEREMFPKAKQAKVDTLTLGARMIERKAAIQENLDEGNVGRPRLEGGAASKAIHKARS